MLFKPNQMPPVLTGNSSIQSVQPQNMNNLGHTIPQPVPPVMGGHFPSVGQDVDLRNVVDPRLNRNMDLDMRSMSANTGPSPMDSSYMRQPPQSQPPPQRPAPISAPFQSDPRQRGDPRVKAQSNVLPMPPAQAPVPNRFPSGIPNDYPMSRYRCYRQSNGLVFWYSKNKSLRAHSADFAIGLICIIFKLNK